MLVTLAATALASVSVLVFYLTWNRPEAVAKPGWQVSLWRDGKTIRGSRHENFPRDLGTQYPEAVAGGSYSLTVQPLGNHLSIHGWEVSAADKPLIEFLLLLPPATLLVCLFRNIIGLNSFGTFAPALLGLAFRDVSSLLGVFVVLTIISAGWWFRRGLHALHLLQVPRTALLLSCVVVVLLVVIVGLSGPGPQAITLFPLVILTGMIERFWSMEEEDGTASSLGVLGATLFIAGCVWTVASIPAVPAWMLRHPETLGLVMAAQLLLGRYTGFRLLELYRFRGMLEKPERSRSIRLVTSLRRPSAAFVGDSRLNQGC